MAETVYECMFLFNANSYAKNPAGATNAVEEIIKSVDGEILAARLWNEQKLAYPVKGHRKGAYWLTYVKMESTEVDKLNRACRLNDLILRHLVIKLDPRLVDPMVAIAKGEMPATAMPDEIDEKTPVELADTVEPAGTMEK